VPILDEPDAGAKVLDTIYGGDLFWWEECPTKGYVRVFAYPDWENIVEGWAENTNFCPWSYWDDDSCLDGAGNFHSDSEWYANCEVDSTEQCSDWISWTNMNDDRSAIEGVVDTNTENDNNEDFGD